MLHYFDRASMAHSLEVRVPFLDHHLVEYCATIPADLKVRRMTTKYVLKEAARGLIPDRIIDKPKIGFFAASVDRWFSAQTDGVIAEYLLAPSPRYAGLHRPPYRQQARLATRRRHRCQPWASTPVIADARDLAGRVPAARASQRCGPGPRVDERTRPAVRGGHARPG